MGHSHEHGHHHHHHSQALTSLNRAFVIGIILNTVFVIFEAAVGLWQGSMALLSDAGHNLSDVASLALALLAFKLAKVKPTERYTYGYRKSTVLVALLNAVILFITMGVIGYEAWLRLFSPEPVQGKTIAIVAFIGILINSITAFLFFKDKEKDLNVKGAYLHLAADALVSLGVVVAGVLIAYTGWYWLDSAISFGIMIIILVGTWNLLMNSLRLTLDAVPQDIDMPQIKKRIRQVAGVIDVHHIHIWAISTTENALTAHLVIDANSSMDQTQAIKKEVRHQLAHMNIQHLTIETEPQSPSCDVKECQPVLPNCSLSGT